MIEVRPDEVSAILREQLSGFKSAADLEEVGTVLQVGDGIARIYGLTKVEAGGSVECAKGREGIVMTLEREEVSGVLFGRSDGIKEGATLNRTYRLASIKVGEGL